MATVSITGTIQDAAGVGVENVVVRLTPAPRDVGSAEAIGGVGIVLDRPVDVFTNSLGVFTATAVQGFRYTLAIPAIGFSRQFVAPTSTVRFDLLGLSPFIEQALNWTDEDSGDNYVSLTVKAHPIATVRERYNQIVVETAVALSGPWTTLDTVSLEPGVTFYTVNDTSGNTSYYYRAKYLNSTTLDVSQLSDAIVGTGDESDLLLTVDELKELYLFGVNLTDDAGNEFPRRMFKHYIQAATAWLAKEIEVSLVASDVVDEQHDHYSQDYGTWGYFQLNQYPVIKIDKVAFQYPSMTDEVEISAQWVQLMDEGISGVIQIVPGQGNLADVLLIPGALMPMWSGSGGRVPAVWKISYRTGFEPGTCPDDIKDVIGMRAAIGIFNIAGDLIAGAGIATKSVGIPGLNQSIGTTSSATNAGYGARIIQYAKQIKEAIPLIRTYYKGIKMVVP